jgi:hypothetical protein
VSPVVRLVILGAAFSATLLAARLFAVELAVTFQPPHVARVAAATLDEGYSRSARSPSSSASHWA